MIFRGAIIRLFVAMNHSTNVQQRRCAGNPEKGGFYKITGITERGEERIAVFRERVI